MANHPYTKTLKKATPTTRIIDGVVKEWNIEVVYTSTENGWKTSYTHKEEVEYLGKTVNQFTKSELLAMMPAVYDNHIFSAHWEAYNVPPTTEKVDNFDLSNLPD